MRFSSDTTFSAVNSRMTANRNYLLNQLYGNIRFIDHPRGFGLGGNC